MGVGTQLRTRGPLRALALATMVNSVGNGAFAATAVVFLSQIQHISGSLIGIGFTAAAIAGLAASIPVGILADRRNAATNAASFAFAAGLTSGLYSFISGAWSFAVVAIVYAVAERGSSIARQALIGVAFDGPERTTARASLRSVSNLGTALGTGLAALVLGLGHAAAFEILFVANAGTYVLAGLMLARVQLPDSLGKVGRTTSTGADEHAIATLRVLRDRRYAVTAATNALLTVHIVILEVVLPLWVVTRTDAPRSIIALLLLANTAIVIVFQLPVSRPFDTVDTAIGGLRLVACLLGAMFLLLGISSRSGAAEAIAMLVLAIAAQTGAEMVQGAASWPLSYDLAPPQHLGEYLGFFALTEQLIQVAGPAGLTFVLIEWSGPGPLILAIAYLALAILAPRLVRRHVGSAAQDTISIPSTI